MCLWEERTVLFLLPAVVAEGGDVVVLYAALHLSQIHATVLLTEALTHVVRHTQGLGQPLLCVTYRTETQNSTRVLKPKKLITCTVQLRLSYLGVIFRGQSPDK